MIVRHASHCLEQRIRIRLKRKAKRAAEINVGRVRRTDARQPFLGNDFLFLRPAIERGLHMMRIPRHH